MFLQHLTPSDKIMLAVLIYVFLGATSNLIINIDIFQMTNGLFTKINNQFTFFNFIFLGLGIFYYGVQRKNLLQTTNDFIYILTKIDEEEIITNDFAKKYIHYQNTTQKFKNSIVESYFKIAKEKILNDKDISEELKKQII